MTSRRSAEIGTAPFASHDGASRVVAVVIAVVVLAAACVGDGSSSGGVSAVTAPPAVWAPPDGWLDGEFGWLLADGEWFIAPDGWPEREFGWGADWRLSYSKQCAVIATLYAGDDGSAVPDRVEAAALAEEEMVKKVVEAREQAVGKAEAAEDEVVQAFHEAQEAWEAVKQATEAVRQATEGQWAAFSAAVTALDQERDASKNAEQTLHEAQRTEEEAHQVADAVAEEALQELLQARKAVCPQYWVAFRDISRVCLLLSNGVSLKDAAALWWGNFSADWAKLAAMARLFCVDELAELLDNARIEAERADGDRRLDD